MLKNKAVLGLPPFYCPSRGDARVSCLGMASPEAGVYNGGVQGQSPWSGVQGSFAPLKLKNLLASECATEAANLPHSVRTLTLSK